ncbi:MAG: flagellar basal-body rod protein FlgF [Deltaproteobacteria bacterium]|nr:MAG: flagellar basal-body rod protein FlgF [Deltaproteobacteria bacterium]TMQ28337.1 MAG: flagellar basal-body rod protein FlgF [Deltaproteobacteria bacterium]
MSSGIYVATAGAVAQSNALDATANNIANAATAGFHGDRVTFREALTAARSPDVATVGAGTTRIDGQAGALTATENPLDLALDGDGYFAVGTPAGPRYTRAGNFQLDDQHRLVTADGFAVRGEGGAPITIPPEAREVAVAADGTVSADGAALGKLELVRFAPAQVVREGGSLVSATGRPLAGDPPKVRSGMLEASNVNVVRGVVDLVKVSRTYESLMRVIQGYHDVESRAARELGAPK